MKDTNIVKAGACNGYFKVDMDKVTLNFGKVNEYVGQGTEIIPVVKGNCYGYGLVPMARHFKEICGAQIVACSAIYEGVTLRQAGLGGDILIIGGVPQHLIRMAVDNDFQIPVFEETTVAIINEYAAKQGKIVKVHIKLETGMNRLGVKTGIKLEEFLDFAQNLKNVEIVGAYSHFATSTADYYDSFAVEQFELFKKGIGQIENRGISLKYVHCCNSAAIAWFKEAYGTHVRSCSSILGHEAMEDGREPIGLEEPVTIRSFITNIHQVYPGETVGYSRSFEATEPMKVATVSVGFADGFCPEWMRGTSRNEKGKIIEGAPVIVSGIRTRFLGCCMDQSFVDVTEIPCELGQSVTLIGRDGSETISTREIEEFTGFTFEYLFGTIGPRIARIYE